MQKGDRKSWTKPHVLSWPEPQDSSTWEDKLLMINKECSKNCKLVQPFCTNYAQFIELTYVDCYYHPFHTSRLKNLVLIEAEAEYVEFRGHLLKKKKQQGKIWGNQLLLLSLVQSGIRGEGISRRKNSWPYKGSSIVCVVLKLFLVFSCTNNRIYIPFWKEDVTKKLKKSNEHT